MNFNFDTVQGLALSQPTHAPSSSNELGQAQFLELMTTQLMNQDPMNPMENGDFLSQIAQFSTVSGIQDLQKSFAQFSSSLSSDQALQAANLVGRSVLVASDEGILSEGNSLEGQVSIPEDASSVQVNILDPSGELVRSLDLGAQPAGQATFAWDGLLENGDRAPSGTYRLEAVADIGGQAVGVKTQVRAEVESVNLGGLGGGLRVNLAGLGTVGFNDVLTIW